MDALSRVWRKAADSLRSAAMLWAGAVALALAMAAPAPTRAEQGSLEYAVKANYLYKFAPFVGWPESAFVSASSPFYLCIAGDDTFDGVLDQAVRGQFLNQHPISVRRLRPADSPTGCHILFAAGSRARSASDILRAIRGEPILTVTDQAGGPSGAIIQFVIVNNRVRFIIDAAAAAANRVTISSKLLSLAMAVKSGGGG